MTSVEPITQNERRTRVVPFIAVIGAALVGLRVELPYSLTIGGAVAFALAPVWIPTLLRNRWTRSLSIIAIIAVASGWFLTQVHAGDHAVLTNDLVARSIALIQLVAVVGLLLWSTRVTSVATTCLSFAVGMALSIPFNISDDPNVWRFTLSIPIGILLLTVVSLKDRLWLVLAVILGLAAVGLMNDSRSNSAFLLLTGVVLVWQRILVRGSRRARGWGGVLTLLATAGALVMLLQSAIVEGYFGEVTQQRTLEQIERGGGVIVGGRPEIAASAALISKYPLGLGAGIRASYEDIQAAKSGMASIGYDPNNGYVERFMFGSGIELHSVVGNMWVWFGLVGVLFALAVGVLVAIGAQRGYVGGCLTAIFVYASLRLVWDLLFSPFGSALRLWPLVLVLAISYASCRLIAPEARLSAIVPREANR